MRSLLLFAALLTSAEAFGQDPIRLEEKLAPNAAYHVSCRVQIAGSLKLPDKTLDVEGKSHIEYDERVVRVNEGVVDKTVRLFSAMDFERKIGTEAQKSSLRPAVYRLFILRQNNIEAPFSPDGLLKLSEVDLIRTDVFTPALVGLLPKNAVAPGATWKADESAMRELTDLNQIKAGELMCRFDKVDRTLAKVSFEGKINGIGENGPTEHSLEGFYYFDTAANMLTYISLKGTESLLDAKGQPQGKVTGTFVLTREPRVAPAAIAESAGLNLEPNEENTRLLFEDDVTGVSFAHNRKWKIQAEGTQIKLDDLRGNGMVLTIDPLKNLPNMQEFLKEARGGIERRKGTVTFAGPTQAAQRQPTTVETIAIDAELPMENATKRGTIVLAVVRDTSAGGTLAATLVTDDRNALAREVERLALSIRVGKGK